MSVAARFAVVLGSGAGAVRSLDRTWIIHNRNLVTMDKPLRILIVLLLIEGENLAL